MYRTLTSGSYKDSSYTADLRRIKKAAAAFELYQDFNYDYQKNDPDFETGSKTYNIIDYVLEENFTNYSDLSVPLLFLNTIAKKNLALKTPLTPTSEKSILYYILTNNIDMIKQHLKNGKVLE